MKTDELIDMLGTNIEPVKDGQLRNTLLIALAVGAVAAFCLMLAILGAPAEAFGGVYFSGWGLWLALAFSHVLVCGGGSFRIVAAPPGTPGRTALLRNRLW